MQSSWVLDEVAFIKLLMMMPHSNWNIPSHRYGIPEKMKNKKNWVFDEVQFYQVFWSHGSIGIFLLLSTLFSQH
jgi:hypothetical protein